MPVYVAGRSCDQNCGADSGGNELTNAMNNSQRRLMMIVNAPVNVSAPANEKAQKLTVLFPIIEHSAPV